MKEPTGDGLSPITFNGHATERFDRYLDDTGVGSKHEANSLIIYMIQL
jgi:hypothetical protein